MKSLKKICMIIGMIAISGMIGITCKAEETDNLDIAICDAQIELEQSEKSLELVAPDVFVVYKTTDIPRVKHDAETWLIDRNRSEFSRYMRAKVKLNNLFFKQYIETLFKIKGE